MDQKRKEIKNCERTDVKEKKNRKKEKKKYKKIMRQRVKAKLERVRQKEYALKGISI